MRRIKNLENAIYRKKYKEIYKLLFTADLDEVVDHSNWYKTNKDIVDIKRPLWIIVESKILNKRIWITEDWGRLGIDTAQLDLDCKSSEYHNSYEWKSFKNQKEMVEYLKILLKPCLEEKQEIEENEDSKFNKNLEEWKNGIEFAEERIKEFYDTRENPSHPKYITLKTVGEKYSKKIANIMFELGYGEWVFNNPKTLESLQQQIIDTLEDDKEINEILKEKNMTREQLYKQIKVDFLENELSDYLQDNGIDIGMIPEEIKNEMVNQVRKGMLDNYSYKYIIWDSGDLDNLIEILPEECFINERIIEDVNSEGEEL